MSDIIINNQTLDSYCSKYVRLCRLLNEKITMAEQNEGIPDLLQQGQLRIQYVLCELQILKVQAFLKMKVTEKQVVILRNKFAKIIGLYQKLFVPQIPCPMQEVAKRIELIDPQYEERWLRDIRMLGLALSLFVNYTQKGNSYLVVLNYQYQFTGIFRNSILYKNLRPQLGMDNYICGIRREQLLLFHRYADEQIAEQRASFARNEALTNLENAIRITRALIELGFITDNEFFDAEFYKKQEKAFTKTLIEKRDSANK